MCHFALQPAAIIEMFRLFAFNEITAMARFEYIILLFVFCWFCFLFSYCVSAFYWINAFQALVRICAAEACVVGSGWILALNRWFYQAQ